MGGYGGDTVRLRMRRREIMMMMTMMKMMIRRRSRDKKISSLRIKIVQNKEFDGDDVLRKQVRKPI